MEVLFFTVTSVSEAGVSAPRGAWGVLALGHVSGRGSKAEQSDLRESLAGHTAGCSLSTGRAVNQPSTHLYISLSLNGITYLSLSLDPFHICLFALLVSRLV